MDRAANRAGDSGEHTVSYLKDDRFREERAEQRCEDRLASGSYVARLLDRISYIATHAAGELQLHLPPRQAACMLPTQLARGEV
jgi:hypothetical protein